MTNIIFPRQYPVMKFITKSLRPLGLFLIFFFAIFCIFGSLFMRDIDDSSVFSKFMDYTISFESRFYDSRMRKQLDPKFKSPDIVLVKIDDYSLQKIGTWPIPRQVHADMLNKLKHFGTKVVALDVMYPEKSPVCGEISPDVALAQALKDFQTDGRRVFMAYTLASSEDESLPEAPVEMLNDTVLTRSSGDVNMYPEKIAKYTFPIQEFVETEVGLASISMSEDRDGIFRHSQLVINVDTIYYGSLGFNAYEAYVDKKVEVKVLKTGTGEIEINNKTLELSQRGETNVRFIGGVSAFPEVSLYDLLIAKDDDEKLRKTLEGKMVFVGSTALGAHDLRPSPIDPKMPGVLIHMNVAHMLLNQYFYQSSNESVKISLYFLLGGMLIFLLIQRLGNAFLDAIMLIIIMAACYYADQYYFLPQGYELKLFYFFFCFIASYSWNTFLLFYEASKEKKQIKGTFARYVAPTIVDEMLKDPDKLQVGGTKKDITCLFSDVRDFTSISEKMSATELAQSLNMYMGKMTDIVFDTKGTLDKYIGDAIVAFWGAPLEVGNHAQHAVEGAIQMMNLLPSINEEFKRLGRPEFKVGIGLNSGECAVGNMGSDRIFSYTALGDNMNLGARLESLCKHYGAQILISEFTLARLDLTNIQIRPIDKAKVKGKTLPVAIFEVLHNEHPMKKDPEALQFYLTAFGLFQKRAFKEALDIFTQLYKTNEEDKPTKRMKELCQKYVDHPELAGDDFEITTMTEK